LYAQEAQPRWGFRPVLLTIELDQHVIWRHAADRVLHLSRQRADAIAVLVCPTLAAQNAIAAPAKRVDANLGAWVVAMRTAAIRIHVGHVFLAFDANREGGKKRPGATAAGSSMAPAAVFRKRAVIRDQIGAIVQAR
jgi:hypothetical protein